MLSRILGALLGLAVPTTVAGEAQVAAVVTWELRYINVAAVTGTTAVAELAIGTAKAKSALVAAKFIPSSGAVTAGATNFFTLLVDARLAATPFTARNLITWAADTTTTDDAAQWDEKDLFTSTYKSATAADFNIEEGEVITVEVTKSGGSGMTFPAGVLVLRFKPRD